jgi:hypothetical protein
MNVCMLKRILPGILIVPFLLTVAISAEETSPLDNAKIERARSDLLRRTKTATLFAATIEPVDFQNPLTIDFSNVPTGTFLGPGYPNPYQNDGIEFMGSITDYDYECVDGNHLMAGEDNDPPEPFVSRLTILKNEGATRVGACVWGQCLSGVSMKAFDEDGLEIASAIRDDCPGPVFMAVETPNCNRPIRVIEWKGLPGSDFGSFPRVDGVMIQFCNGCSYKIVGDLNDDCVVNIDDIALLLENWLVDCNVVPTDLACVPK